MNWESLIAERIAAHRDTYAPQRIEDSGKRNSRRAQLKWKHEHHAAPKPDTARCKYCGNAYPVVELGRIGYGVYICRRCA